MQLLVAGFIPIASWPPSQPENHHGTLQQHANGQTLSLNM